MSQLLADAKALKDLFSDEEKWTKGELFTEDDAGEPVCYCTLGGIDKVTGALDSYNDSWVFGHETEEEKAARSENVDRACALQYEVEAVVGVAYPQYVYGSCPADIAEWNDADERTVEEVQEVCAKVVERVSAQAGLESLD